MTPLHPTNLIAIPVPEEAESFESYKDRSLWFYENGCHFIAESFDFDFKILGTVTSDTIDFDVEPYVENKIVFEDFGTMYKIYDKCFPCWTKHTENSFRSLLSANDALFENPYGDNRHLYEASEEALRKWQTAQSKLVKKLVILEKI